MRSRFQQPSRKKVMDCRVERLLGGRAGRRWDAGRSPRQVFLAGINTKVEAEDRFPPLREATPALIVSVSVIAGTNIGVCGPKMAVDQGGRELGRPVIDIDIRALAVTGERHLDGGNVGHAEANRETLVIATVVFVAKEFVALV